MTDPLVHAVREVERHVAASGWDRPPALFALVPSADLIRDEPVLAEQLGLRAAPPGTLTAVAQEDLTYDASLPDLLRRIDWPPEVVGAVLVLETVSLPADAEADAPPDGAAGWAAGHARREEARVVVGVLRDGARAAALRWRSHDHDDDVLSGADLAPAIALALADSFASAR